MVSRLSSTWAGTAATQSYPELPRRRWRALGQCALGAAAALGIGCAPRLVEVRANHAVVEVRLAHSSDSEYSLRDEEGNTIAVARPEESTLTFVLPSDMSAAQSTTLHITQEPGERAIDRSESPSEASVKPEKGAWWVFGTPLWGDYLKCHATLTRLIGEKDVDLASSLRGCDRFQSLEKAVHLARSLKEEKDARVGAESALQEKESTVTRIQGDIEANSSKKKNARTTLDTSPYVDLPSGDACATMFVPSAQPKPFSACEPKSAALYAVGACVVTKAACPKAVDSVVRLLKDSGHPILAGGAGLFGNAGCDYAVGVVTGQAFDADSFLQDMKKKVITGSVESILENSSNQFLRALAQVVREVKTKSAAFRTAWDVIECVPKAYSVCTEKYSTWSAADDDAKRRRDRRDDCVDARKAYEEAVTAGPLLQKSLRSATDARDSARSTFATAMKNERAAWTAFDAGTRTMPTAARDEMPLEVCELREAARVRGVAGSNHGVGHGKQDRATTEPVNDPPTRRRFPARTFVATVFGVSAAGAVVSSLLASSADHDVSANCKDGRCNLRGMSAVDRYRATAWSTDIFLSVAGAALITLPIVKNPPKFGGVVNSVTITATPTGQVVVGGQF